MLDSNIIYGALLSVRPYMARLFLFFVGPYKWKNTVLYPWYVLSRAKPVPGHGYQHRNSIMIELKDRVQADPNWIEEESRKARKAKIELKAHLY